MSTIYMGDAQLKKRANPKARGGKPNNNKPKSKEKTTSSFNRYALTVIETMVKAGFHFFSSVVISSKDHACELDSMMQEGDAVSVDSMFFHLPDRACIVKIALVGKRIKAAKRAQMYLDAQVFTEHSYQHGLAALKLEFALAKSKGFIKKVRYSDYVDLETEVPNVPWLHCKPQLALWRVLDSGQCDGTCSTRVSTERIGDDAGKDTIIEPLSELIESILASAMFCESGKVQEVFQTKLVPLDLFPDCAEDFWSRFNSRVFRQIVREHI